MTTGARIVVCQADVEAALAEWHAELLAAEKVVASDVVEENRSRTYTQPSGDYARDVAPYVFSLLTKYGTKP